MSSICIAKFGGTSMTDATCMVRSAKVSYERNAHIVVVSASSGTTNDLIALAQSAEKKSAKDYKVILNKIIERHKMIAAELKLSDNLKNQLEDIFDQITSLARGIHLMKECSPKAMDKMQSFGERMSSALFTQAMQQVLEQHQVNKHAELFDVRQVLKTDNQFGKARPLTEKIIEKCFELLPREKMLNTVWVTQGFIGETLNGETTTLGRGGSDYTAAILAEGVGAGSVEIWTDVPGIASTDPRLVAAARPIAEISFQEASELAIFGAKVLHPATLLPAVRKNIPVFVGSSFDSGQQGTWIRREVSDHPTFRALALRRKQALLTLSTPEMLQTHGFLFRVFEVFNRHKVSIDAITTSEISVAVTVDDATLQNQELLQELTNFCSVQVEKDLCLVSVIGNHMNHTSGIAEKIFDAINNINVRMICLGASRHNFCLVLDEKDGASAIERLHSKLLG